MHLLARVRPRGRGLVVVPATVRRLACTRPLTVSATLASSASTLRFRPTRTISSAPPPVRPWARPPTPTPTPAQAPFPPPSSPTVPGTNPLPDAAKQSALQAFRRLPLSPGMMNLLTEQLVARHALRLDQNDASPIQLSLIQRLSFKYFFDHRELVQHPVKSQLSWVPYVRAPGFFFPHAPGSSTLLAGETGGGKTLAYLLPLLQRLIATRSGSGPGSQQQDAAPHAHEQAAGATAGLEASAKASSAPPHQKTQSGEDLTLEEEEEYAAEARERDEDEQWTEDDLAALLEYEQETANDPDHIADEDLDEVEALLDQYDESSDSINPAHTATPKNLKGRFAAPEQLSRIQSRAQQQADQVDQWTPKLRSDPSDQDLVRPRSVILVPTHELARQVEAQVKALTYVDKLRTVCTSRVHWFSTLEKEVRARARGESVRPIDVLVTTPERLYDLVSSADQRTSRWQALHRRYKKEGNVVAAEKIEKAAQSDAEHKLLVSLDQVQAMVCDEADTLWAQEHFDATRHIVRSVYDTRIEDWRRTHGKGNGGLVPADILHVTATVDPGFKRQLLNRFPGTKELRSKLVHRLPPNVSVKVAPVYPRLSESFANEVRNALLWDKTDRSRVLVVCELKRTVERFSRLLNNEGILNVKLTSEMRDRSTSSHSTLKNFTLDARKLLSGPPAPEPKQAQRQETQKTETEALNEPAGQDLAEPVSDLAASQADDHVAQVIEGSEVDPLTFERSTQAYDYDDVELDQEAERQREREQAVANGVDPLVLERRSKRKTQRTERNGSTIPPPHPKETSEEENGARVLLTTSHLTRGLDFSPLVTHVFIPDSYANLNLHRTIDPKLPERHVKSTMELLHRAGRVGRLGTKATLVLFDKLDLQTGKPLNEAKGPSVAAHLKSATKGLKTVPFTPRKKEREWTLGDGADKPRKPVKFDPLDEGYAPSRRSRSRPSKKLTNKQR